MSPTLLRNVDTVEIMNIHHDDMEFSLVDEIYKNLDPPKGKARSFPTLLLYDTKGLKLFEDITYLDEYYLTNTEIEILTKHAKRIVARIPENAQLVELGSGSVTPHIFIRRLARLDDLGPSSDDRLILETCARSRFYFENANGLRRRWITMLWISHWGS